MLQYNIYNIYLEGTCMCVLPGTLLFLFIFYFYSVSCFLIFISLVVFLHWVQN